MGLAGELGMMQIKPSTADFIATTYKLTPPEEGWIRLLWDYKLNIKYGCLYLRYLTDKFNSINLALEYYNGGSARQSYAATILKNYNELLLVAKGGKEG